jgi:hypothetical protein
MASFLVYSMKTQGWISQTRDIGRTGMNAKSIVPESNQSREEKRFI